MATRDEVGHFRQVYLYRRTGHGVALMSLRASCTPPAKLRDNRPTATNCCGTIDERIHRHTSPPNNLKSLAYSHDDNRPPPPPHPAHSLRPLGSSKLALDSRSANPQQSIRGMCRCLPRS